MTSNNRYKAAGVFTAGTFEEQAKAIANAGYAGKGNEEKYFDLITKVGTTVGKALENISTIVVKNKSAFGLGSIAVILLAGYILSTRNGK